MRTSMRPYWSTAACATALHCSASRTSHATNGRRLAGGGDGFGRWIAGTDDDVGAVLHERGRHDPADALGASGHDDALAGEVEGVREP